MASFCQAVSQSASGLAARTMRTVPSINADN